VTEGIDVRIALRDTFFNSRLASALIVGTMLDLIAQLYRGPAAFFVIAVTGALTTGYVVVCARNVARRQPEFLVPWTREPEVILRRGSFLLLATLPPYLLASAPLFAASWPFHAPAQPIPALVSAAMLIVSGATLVVFGARFVYRDDFRDAFRYGDSVRVALAMKASLGVVAALLVGWSIISAGSTFAASLVLGDLVREAADQSLRALLAGRFSVRVLLVLGFVVASTVINWAASLVGSHLLGQYARLAFKSRPESGSRLA